MAEWYADISKMAEKDIKHVIKMGSETAEFRTGTHAAQFYYPETLRTCTNDKNGIALVAKIKGRFAGFVLGYYMEGTRDGYINAIAVAEKVRHSNVGSQLLKAALEKFKIRGCNHVFGLARHDNLKALDFLKKNGFEIGECFRYVEIMLPQD